MIEHTPGPWEVDYGGSVGHVKSLANRESGKTPTVARYDIFPAGSALALRQKANAKLIAAAPDLLNACRAAFDAIMKHCAETGDVIWIDLPHQLPFVHESVCERLRNVIAQADPPKPRQKPRELMRVYDAGPAEDSQCMVVFYCWRCHHKTDWMLAKSVSQAKRGIPCPKCNE